MSLIVKINWTETFLNIAKIINVGAFGAFEAFEAFEVVEDAGDVEAFEDSEDSKVPGAFGTPGAFVTPGAFENEYFDEDIDSKCFKIMESRNKAKMCFGCSYSDLSHNSKLKSLCFDCRKVYNKLYEQTKKHRNEELYVDHFGTVVGDLFN